ncbi:MAG: 2-oxo-4-hydroxy-4-carboxy-5-ureidoimidazoline decarboxylase [Candidatus Dormibacteraeota bacterium]|nr:2-oxo-4-hydroxy-4-carboxy-5-ureidoimidazoline decarboxylase [Candidatus Dormibacteraeota bacterium]
MAPSAAELFEPSSALGRRLAGSPDPVGEARRLLTQLSEAEKVQTLNAHPRVGERRDRISTSSRVEQGEDQAPPELELLNQEYERRFGFRFVVFVNGRSKAEITEVLRERLGKSRADEIDRGLTAIVDIAADRLGKLDAGAAKS